MAYSTVPSTSNGLSNAVVQTPNNVITVAKEKQFVRDDIFFGDTVNYKKSNIYENIYDTDINDSYIPLTSVIYTPSKVFFESSKFFKRIPKNSRINVWMRKHNILVLVFGLSSHLDCNMLEASNTTGLNDDEASMLFDVMKSSMSLSTISRTHNLDTFKDDITSYDTKDSINNLLKFENSPFNYRLNTINERINVHYKCNFAAINHLVFNQLNDELLIIKFMKNTININLV